MRKSTRFPKIQVYQVSHVDVCQFLRRIELELSEIRVESDETKFAWKWNSVNPNLFGRVASSPFNKNAWTKNIWTPTANKATCSILLILQKKGKILTSCTSPRWDHLGSCFPNEMFRGTRSKLHRFATQTWNYCSTYWDSARVVSSLSAWDLDLVQEPLQSTLAAGMIPKKTKLQTLHISIDA